MLHWNTAPTNVLCVTGPLVFQGVKPFRFKHHIRAAAVPWQNGLLPVVMVTHIFTNLCSTCLNVTMAMGILYQHVVIKLCPDLKPPKHWEMTLNMIKINISQKRHGRIFWGMTEL